MLDLPFGRYGTRLRLPDHASHHSLTQFQIKRFRIVHFRPDFLQDPGEKRLNI